MSAWAPDVIGALKVVSVVQRARILDIMSSPKAQPQRCELRRPSSCPAAVVPPSCMDTPDGKGIAQQVGQRTVESQPSVMLSAVLVRYATCHSGIAACA